MEMIESIESLLIEICSFLTLIEICSFLTVDAIVPFVYIDIYLLGVRERQAL